MNPPEPADALAEHYAAMNRFALSEIGALLPKFELAVRRDEQIRYDEKPRDASIKAAWDNYCSIKAALIEAVQALQAKAASE